MRSEHALQILELVFSSVTQEKAQMYRRGRQCKVSEGDCGLPTHAVSSPGQGEAFSSGLREAGYSSQRLCAHQSLGTRAPITPNHS